MTIGAMTAHRAVGSCAQIFWRKWSTAVGLRWRGVRIPYALHLGVVPDQSCEVTGGMRGHACIVSDRVSMADKNMSFRDFISINCWTDVEIAAFANQA